jgi:hypothetical protein
MGTPLPLQREAFDPTVPPPPGPEIFDASDRKWLLEQATHAIRDAKALKGPQEALVFTANTLHLITQATVAVSIAASARALTKYYREISPKFSEFHTHVCSLWGRAEADKRRVDALEYRVEELEKLLHLSGKTDAL